MAEACLAPQGEVSPDWHGAPVHASSAPKTDEELQVVIKQGPYQSAIAHQDFLWGEAYEMC